MPNPTYWDYLKIDQLLTLQTGDASEEDELSNDELHFIIVHQVFELWFKLILLEIRAARDHLMTAGARGENLHDVIKHLRRVNKTLAVAAQHWELLETLPAQDFLEFRDKLLPASGAQSFQFPEIEIILGLEESLRASTGVTRPLDHIEKNSASSRAGACAWRHIERARQEKTLRSALYEWLHQTRIWGSRPGDEQDAEVVQDFLRYYFGEICNYYWQQMEQAARTSGPTHEVLKKKYEASCAAAKEFLFALDKPVEQQGWHRRLRAGLLFIESHQDLPAFSWAHTLIETAIELEHLLVFWRCRHARSAERLIGYRPGTGGYSVNYLDQTLAYRIFSELSAGRTLLAPRRFAPRLTREAVTPEAG
jgi:tryptophan 2,3-dioxygenase